MDILFVLIGAAILLIGIVVGAAIGTVSKKQD